MKKQDKSTKEVKHHISSGGFVFHKDKKNSEIYVLLVMNKKGEYWIPKGHIEGSETQEEAAFREIEEETTIKRVNLKYVGFCSLIKYTFVEGGRKNSKEVYINVFEALKKEDLIPSAGDDEISDIKWFEYSDALEIISFNKEELNLSKDIFVKYLCS